eukprot:scaffold3631_cov124-Isochrysis_galbana.AAC.5
MDFVRYFSPIDRVGGKGRVNPKISFRVGINAWQGEYMPVFQCLIRAHSEARRRRVLPRWARRGRCAVAQSDAHRGWRWLEPQAREIPIFLEMTI